MNNARRKQISKIKEMLEDIVYRLEDLANEEQEAFDNMPESIQGTERGEAMEDAVYHLTDAKDEIERVAYDLEDLI